MKLNVLQETFASIYFLAVYFDVKSLYKMSDDLEIGSGNYMEIMSMSASNQCSIYLRVFTHKIAYYYQQEYGSLGKGTIDGPFFNVLDFMLLQVAKQVAPLLGLPERDCRRRCAR